MIYMDDDKLKENWYALFLCIIKRMSISEALRRVFGEDNN
jgi:hypothetical protein